MIASCDQKPVTLRISVTDRCQLRCRYCMPAEGIALCGHDDILSFEEIARFVDQVQTRYTVEKLRLTGGEPLVRRGIESLVMMLAERGIPDIALTTNAQLLKTKAVTLRAAGLRRINVSLDSLDADTYRSITGGDVQRSLDGLHAAAAAGLHPVKLNMVVMRGRNDTEIEPMLAFAVENGFELRYLELMPLGIAAHEFDERFVSTAEIKERLRGWLGPARHDRAADTSRTYRVRDAAGRTGTVGFVSPSSEPFCGACRRLRLTSDGRLIGCLAREESIPVREFLAAPNGTGREGLGRAIETALSRKKTGREFTRERAMSAVGG